MRILSLAAAAAAFGLSAAQDNGRDRALKPGNGQGGGEGGGNRGGGGGGRPDDGPTNAFPDDDRTQPGGARAPPPATSRRPDEKRAERTEDELDSLQGGRASNPNKGRKPDPSGRGGGYADMFRDGSGDALERVVVKLEGGALKGEGRRAAKDAARLVTLDLSEDYGIMAMLVPANACRGLMNRPGVKYCEKDADVAALGWPELEDPDVTDEERLGARHRALTEDIPWGIHAAQVQDLWGLAPNPPDRKIRVCVADTGYGLGHPDLHTLEDGVRGFSQYGQQWDVDGHGHGTHCSGSIGALGGNGEGVVGVFPDTDNIEFVVAKALSDGGSGSSSGVMEAVTKCVEMGAQVVSMSLGCDECYSSTADELYTDLYTNNNTLIVAAAGNSGNTARSYPASYRAVVSVVALEVAPEGDPKDWRVADFSQVNDQVEIGGPGVNVKSTVAKNGGSYFSYATWSGTSMATPHVAAVAAMVWNFYPQCANWQIRNALILSAYHPDGHDHCTADRGYGMVQAKDMYDMLEQYGCGAGGINPEDGVMIGGCNQTTTTMPPTISPAPTTSPYPTGAPTRSPTPAPTVSQRPSAVPTHSLMPSIPPTQYPTYSPTSEARLTLTPPESDHFQIVPGFMFDIEAKESIVVHNLDYLLYNSAAATLEIYTHDGPWEPVKNSPANWTLVASVPGLTGGGCLDYPKRLPRNSFAPIRIEAGNRRGFYFRLPDSSNQRLALDNRGFNEDGTYGHYHGNNDAAVCDGVFKDHWDHYSGTPFDSYRYTGTVYYTIDGSRFPTAAPTDPPTGLSPTAYPTSSPTAGPTAPRTVIGSYPTTSSTMTVPGAMFDVVASPNGTGMVVHSFDVRIYHEGPPVTLEIYTKLGSHAEARNDATRWTQIGTVEDLWGSGSWPSNPPVRLPPRSFPPQDVGPGQTRAFYVRVQGGMDAGNKLQFDGACSNYGQPYFTSDEGHVVLEGLWKRHWTDSSVSDAGSGDPVGWQGSFYVTKLGTEEPTEAPTSSSAPSSSPSISPTSVPTVTPKPTPVPTAAPTGTPIEPTEPPTDPPTPTPSAAPSGAPTGAPATPRPTNGVERLSTPSSNGFWLKRGVYVDVMAGDTPVLVDDMEIYSSSYSGRVEVWTKLGSSEGTMTAGDGWELIADTVDNWSSGWSGGPKAPSWTFEPVVVPANAIRSFYVKSTNYLYLTAYPDGAAQFAPWISNVAPAIPLTLCHGTGAGSNRWTTSGLVDFYGSIVYRDLGPTAAPTASPSSRPTLSAMPSAAPTASPSASPTISLRPSASSAPTSEYTEERSVSGGLCSSCSGGRGNQFDVDVYRDMRILGLDIHTYTTGTKSLVVWMRRDSYKSGERHNNFDGGWTRLLDVYQEGEGSGGLTALPPFDPPIEASAGETLSFTVAFKRGTYMRFHRGTSNATPLAGSNDDMTVYEGASVSDYYGDNVGTAYGLSTYYTYVFNGRVRYEVKNGGDSVPNPFAAGGAAEAAGASSAAAGGDGLLGASASASDYHDPACGVCFEDECDGDDGDDDDGGDEAAAGEEEDVDGMRVNCDDETYAYVYDDGSVGCSWVADDPASRCGICQATDDGALCAYERCACTCAQFGGSEQ